MIILLLTADLMIVSQVESAARKQGVTIQTVSSATAAADQRDPGVNLVLIDLGLAGLDIQTLVGPLRSLHPAARIVAFGPHVHEAKLAAARDAGCDEVTSRGGFLAQLDTIVNRCVKK